MKNINFLFLVYVVVLSIFSSCESTLNPAKEVDTFDTKVDRVTFSENEYDRILRLQKWGEITPEQRYYLWVDKLKQTLTKPISEQQRLLIEQLIADLTPSLFDYNNVQFSLILKSLEDKYLPKVEEYFTFDEQVRIFASLLDFNPTHSISELKLKDRQLLNDSENIVESRRDCNCRWSCWPEDDYAICGPGDCARGSLGCGFLWLQGCSGVCRFFKGG